MLTFLNDERVFFQDSLPDTFGKTARDRLARGCPAMK